MIAHTLPHDEQGKGPILVLVPGLDGTALLFYRQIPALARRFEVLTFPLPDDSECTMQSLIEDLYALIQEVTQQHGQDRVLLCGESFGGALSLSFALAHPEMLTGLVILNSFPRIRNRLGLSTGIQVLKAIPWGAMKFVRRFTEWKLHSPHTHADDLADFHELMLQVGKQGYIRRLEILKDYDIRDRLSEIETPTLFLAAERDKLVPSSKEARFMADRMPNAQTVMLKGYGHICLINHDFNLMDYLQPWLERLTLS